LEPNWLACLPQEVIPVALVDLSPDRSRSNAPDIICGRHSADPDSLRP
jgi:hypothetical protein